MAVFSATSNSFASSRLSNDEICCEWQVRTVMFDCAERLHKYRLRTDFLEKIRRRHLSNFSVHRHISESTEGTPRADSNANCR